MKAYHLLGIAGAGVVIYLLARTEKFEPATPLSETQKKAIEAMNKHAEKQQ